MKLVSALLILLVGGCTSIKIAQPVHIDFRGAELGQPPLGSMVQQPRPKQLGLTRNEVTDSYVIPNEPKTLGSLDIANVEYEYVDNRLMQVHVNLWTPGQHTCSNSPQIVAALQSRYEVKLEVEGSIAEGLYQAVWRSSDAVIFHLCHIAARTNMIVFTDRAASRIAESRFKAILKRRDAEASSAMKKGM